MDYNQDFTGFPKAGVQFLEDLANNNDKVWFNKNRTIYDEQVLQPARLFVMEMGKRLEKVAPGVIADPRVDQSIFRIYRDIRFSPNKMPFKTHLGIFFWEGSGKKMESSGFYFHLEPPNILLAAGMHIFPDYLLRPYRDTVIDPLRSAPLLEALKSVQSKKEYLIGDVHYKRVPRGYDADHPNAELLRYNGLYSYIEIPIPEELFTSQLTDFCFQKFKDMAPLHHWLYELTEHVKS
jgi:uncharacterized protein (TIGR02453 family)